ncbi:hypothetical protein ACFVMC_06410 [Nocardia sp. NPDC127579]|uniref:hypothetical protein n=1 Tax=Nocardia sp. NPDC127579 TaxID=3345402 RepID=UPI00363066E1
MHAHNPAQVIRHTAIVFAGAASIALTGAAGAYIMTQMSDVQRSQSAPPAPQSDHYATDSIDTGFARPAAAVVLTGERRRLPVSAAGFAPEPVLPQVVSTAPAATGLTGTLRLGTTTYVGAQVAPVHSNTLAITVDTNVFSALSEFLRSEGLDAQAGVTYLRSEFDSRGGLTMTVSDPAIGEHAIQLNRTPTPVQTPEAPIASETPEPGTGTITV